MKNILVAIESFNGEFKKSGLQAVSYGKEVAVSSGGSCLVVVNGETLKAGTLGTYGADRVLQFNKRISSEDTQALTNQLAELAALHDAGMIILPNNSTARGIAGRLSVKMKSGCATGVQNLPTNMEGESVVVSRSVFAGKATAAVKVSGPCVILSLSPNASQLKTWGNEVIVESVEVKGDHESIKMIESKIVTGRTPLPEAELVVSGGRGMKDPSNWGIIEDLAEALGATTACSRPVADAHWRPHYEHVGQTGIAIKPNLYIAIGISGAIQHLAGVNNSKVIVVINKDPDAPFFKAADYGVCGDLFEVVPRLTEAVKKFKHSNS
ncbi:MAG: electron transfer flavoprotein subunit alpha/FixB family protein [Saprospiraceae bacterium]